MCPVPELLTSTIQFLPLSPSLSVYADESADVCFEFFRESDMFGVARNGEDLRIRASSSGFLERLETVFQLEIAQNAPEAVFVHAGAVAVGRRAAVFPGASFAGKSTLIDALVKRGAVYLSDEYAVIDRLGRVHPYRRPISLRQHSGNTIRVDPRMLTEPTHIGHDLALVLSCLYRRRARWFPVPMSRGQAVLDLFANTVSAQLTPERDVEFLTAATDKSRCLRSERGDARRVAGQILQLLSSSD